MVLSLAFILAFIGSAVALLIGIILFSEVEASLAGTFGVSQIVNDPLVNGTLPIGSAIQLTTGNADDGLGHDDDTDYITGFYETDFGAHVIWGSFSNPVREVNYATIPFSTHGTASGSVQTNAIGAPELDISNRADGLYLMFVSSDGQEVQIMCECDDPVGSGEAMQYIESNDGGTTWGALTLVADPVGLDGGIFPQYSDSDGTNIVGVFRVVNNNAPFDNPFMFVSSQNGGTTFGSPSLLQYNDTNFDTGDPTVKVDGSNVHVTITNGTSGDLAYFRSTDGGANFSAPQILTGTVPLDQTSSQQPRIQADGNDVTLYAIGSDGTGKLTQFRSTNGGSSFGLQEVPFDGSVCKWNEIKNNSQPLAFDGTIAHATCVGLGAGSQAGIDMLTSRTENNGATWEALHSIMTGTGSDPLDEFSAREFDVNVDGNNVYFRFSFQDNAGTDQMTGHASGRGNGFVATFDKGATFTGAVYSCNGGDCPDIDGFQTGGEDGRKIAVSGSDIYLIEDHGNTNLFVYYEFDKGSIDNVSNTPQAFAQASNIAFTVIAILPVALFFALFAIFSGRSE